MENYTKTQVSEITGLSPRQVQFYTDEKVVEPEADKGEGRGKVRKYSKKNLVEFCIIERFVGYGATLQVVKRIFELLRFNSPSASQGAKKLYPDLVLLEGSIVDKWDTWPPDSFLILYRMANGKYHHVVVRGGGENILPLGSMENCESALVINLGRVIEQVQKQ